MKNYKPAGSYLIEVLNQWGPYMGEEFAKLAAESDMTLYLAAFVWHQGVPPELQNANEEQIRQSMEQRIRQILGFVHKGGKAQVDFITEALWCSGDSCGWEKSPYYRIFGDNLISETYLMAYKIANEMGLVA